MRSKYVFLVAVRTNRHSHILTSGCMRRGLVRACDSYVPVTQCMASIMVIRIIMNSELPNLSLPSE